MILSKGELSMSTYYLQYDLDRIKTQRQGNYYVPSEFSKNIRLELKWAYTAILHSLIDIPKFNDNQEAYLDYDLKPLCQTLSLLANKPVDVAKIEGYIRELEENDLLELRPEGIYLKRII